MSRPEAHSGTRNPWLLGLWLAACLMLLIVGLARGATGHIPGGTVIHPDFPASLR